MCQAKALREEVQCYASHDAGSYGKHTTVDDVSRSGVAFTSDLEPQRSNAGPQWLADTAKKRAPEHSFPSIVDGKVQWKRHCEALGDVMNKERHEDREA